MFCNPSSLIKVFREAVEIKKNFHQKVALNRDTGETYLSPIYNELINSDRFYLNKKNYHILQPNLICVDVLPGKRLAFKNALYKLKN
jgi:hypothetical protein